LASNSRIRRKYLTYAVAAAVILILALIRVYHLDADPPTDLSKSTDVYTDTGQYTLWARMYVQSGAFNPFHDFRFIFFLKSSVTALAVVVYKLFGTGFWQSNLVGLLYAIGALLLFAVFLRKIAGNVTALIFLLFAGLNYNLIFYGKLPFLEHAMAFYGFLALVLLTYGRKWLPFALGGMSLAVAIFFGKVIGMVFLFPFGCLLVYRLMFDRPETPKISYRSAISFVAGFALVTAIWYFSVYRPMQAQVAGYLEEQTVSLYGSPEGLKSIDDFMFKMVTFGILTDLFSRMAVPGLLTAVFVLMILFHVGRFRSWKDGFGRWNAGHVFIAAMMIAFFGALMIWNYRPLRYQLILIYPTCAGASVLLAGLWNGWRHTEVKKTPILFYPFCFLVTLVPLYQLYGKVLESRGTEFYYTSIRYYLFVASALVTAGVAVLISAYRKNKFSYSKLPVRAAVAVIVLVVVGGGISRYYFWTQRPTFISRDASRDLAMAISPEAVVSGPYAADLTQGTTMKAVIHMFGVSKADPDLFKRFPITHLLVDEANERRAKEDYPEVMDHATHVLSYVIGSSKVRLWRVAGATGNRMADTYPRSLLELARDNYAIDNVKQANEYAKKFLMTYPSNMSGYVFLGNMAEKLKSYNDGELLLKKAIEFSPTSYVLMKRLAEFYRDRFKETGNEEYRRLGLEQYQRAIHLAPNISDLKEAYKKLKENDLWQTTPDTTL
jgi:4-amino-4-deoxy-L-arabinose transferase-like glycosyltransferase